MLMKTHLNRKNLFLAINSWARSVIRYSAAFLDWTKEETKELDRWTRKQLLIDRALHRKSNVMRIYLKCRCGGQGLLSVEECAAELRSIDFYLTNSKEESTNDYKSRIEREKIDKLRSMKQHRQVGRNTDNKNSEKVRYWLRNGSLKRETETLLSAAQEQALNSNSVRKVIIKMSQIYKHK